jgi:zinc protease
MTTALRPVAGTPRPWHFPAFERRTLPSGLQMIVAPVHKLPLVTVLAVVDAGADTDPVGREGVAQLAAQAMTEGTATRDANALAEAAESIGVAIDASADWNGGYAGFTALASRLGPSLDLLAEILQAPGFPEREVDRLRAERLADLLHLQSEPRGLADVRFSKFVYRGDSRFARPSVGTRDTVTALDAAACRAAWAARWRPKATTLVIAGDVTIDEATRQVERALGGWRGDAPAPASPDDRPVEGGRAVHLVDKPGAPQSELRVGHVGVPRRHPDFFPLTIMNAILGGVFTSRLNLNLRERHGYTYGAFSGFDWRRAAGPFVASTAVQTSVTKPALEEIVGELTRIREAPVTAEELSLAQAYFQGVFPIRFETTAAIADALSALVTFRLPDDYYDTYRDHVRAVTAEDVLAAAQRHLRLDALQVVLVGDAGVVRAPLEDWGFAPVQVHAADAE